MQQKQRTARIATAVYSFSNGMTVVVDQFGKRMPEFRGAPIDVASEIVAAGGHVPFFVLNVPPKATS